MTYTIEHNTTHTKIYFCINGDVFGSLSELLRQYSTATKQQ
jgi:hypothetical protein